MAYQNQDWDALGRNIQELIDQAINSQDYRKLNQTITRTVSRAVDAGGEAVRRAASSAARTVDAAARTVASEKPKPLPVLYGRTEGKLAAGIAKVVGGSILTAAGCALFFSGAVLSIVAGITWVPMMMDLLGLLGLGPGVPLLVSGIRTAERLSRFKKYCRVLGGDTHCAVVTLAQSVGKPEKFVRKDLTKMIDSGLFLEGHLDREGKDLITSHETYRHYEQSRLALEQRQREAQEEAKRQQETKADPRVQEVLDRGNAFLREIRRCNDAIPGEQISTKISRMEMIVRRIFERAEAHPEIVPDLKKLMDYYLPMTVKLLNAYAEMDAQPVQGETIRASKKEIEETLDTLNYAFEKLLDDLFQDAAMDVSSDISVLNTLLAQEGLTDDGFSNLKKRENGV